MNAVKKLERIGQCASIKQFSNAQEMIKTIELDLKVELSELHVKNDLVCGLFVDNDLVCGQFVDNDLVCGQFVDNDLVCAIFVDNENIAS